MSRLVAVAIDFAILLAIDILVVYFTMQDLRPHGRRSGRAAEGAADRVLRGSERRLSRRFTAGGQTLGKMAMGIKVISTAASEQIDVPHSLLRTVLWLLLAIPAGLGFLTALFSPERRGLHDRFAGTRVIQRGWVKRPIVALSIATAFGVGYVPFAPGTFGSAVGLVIWALLPSSPAAHAAAILVMFAVGAWSGTVAERHFAGTDPGPVVIDEVMGMLLTLFMHPVGWGGAARRVLPVSRLRRPEAVPGQSPRAAAWRPRCHGRRWDGGGVREPRALGRPCRARLAVVKACIIAVGSELLTPFRVDTNSLAITERLNAIGYEIRMKAVLGDDVDELAKVLAAAFGTVDLIVTTGGLGPTADDITRDAIAKALTLPLDLHEPIVDRLRARFAERGLTMPEINRRQAMVPRAATVIENRNGSAPGLWLERGGTALLVLPGPPREMIPMLEGSHRGATGVALRRRRPLPARPPHHRPHRIGRRRAGRADLLAMADDAGANRDDDSRRLGTDRTAPDRVGQSIDARPMPRCEAAVGELQAELGSVIYSVDGRPLEAVVGDLLRQAGWTIAAAESCTGGLLMSRLTDVPGSSDYVDRGRGLLQRSREGRAAGRVGRPHRGARCGQRAGRAGDGRRHPQRGRKRRGHRHHGHCRSRRRHCGKAGRNGRRRRRHQRRSARANVPASSAAAKWSSSSRRRRR